MILPSFSVHIINHYVVVFTSFFQNFPLTSLQIQISSLFQKVQLRRWPQHHESPQRWITYGTTLIIQVIDNARKFADTHLMPRVIEEYRNEKFDKNLMKLMGENGFLGCTLNTYGLPGLSATSYGLINR